MTKPESQTAPAQTEQGFATVQEAMVFLCVSQTQVYAFMAQGSLPFAKFGRSRRIPWAALREFAARAMSPRAGTGGRRGRPS